MMPQSPGTMEGGNVFRMPSSSGFLQDVNREESSPGEEGTGSEERRAPSTGQDGGGDGSETGSGGGSNRKPPTPSVSSTIKRTSHHWYTGVAEEASRYARLNPDAPEFAPVFEAGPRSAPPAPERGHFGGTHRYGEDLWDFRESPTSEIPSTVSSGQALVDPSSYTIPLKSGSNFDDGRDKRLRRTASESHLMSGVENGSSYASVSPVIAQSGMGTRAGVSTSVIGSTNRAQQYITPNPSPSRRGSLTSSHNVTSSVPPGAQGPTSESTNRDSLVMRTKALLEHQMRTNLAFAEAVAAEYGRELSARIETQRRAFMLEQNRRVQMMELTIRRRVAEAEDALRRQYEDRQALASRIIDVRHSLGNGANLDPRSIGMDPQELESISPAVQRRIAELVREMTIARTEVEIHKQAMQRLQQELIRTREDTRAAAHESGNAAEVGALRQALRDEREQRLLLEEKASALESSLQDQRARDWEEEVTKFMSMQVARDGAALSKKRPDELLALILEVEAERERLSKDNILLTRRIEALENEGEAGSLDSESRPPDYSSEKLESEKEMRVWFEPLQREILSLEKSLMWTAPTTPRISEIRTRMLTVLQTLESQSEKLRNLLRDDRVPEGKRKDFSWDSGVFVESGLGGGMFSPTESFDPFATMVQKKDGRMVTVSAGPSSAMTKSETASHSTLGTTSSSGGTSSRSPKDYSYDIVGQMYASAGFDLQPHDPSSTSAATPSTATQQQPQQLPSTGMRPSQQPFHFGPFPIGSVNENKT
ncbi:uncharacterized protein SPPG_08816 [Spizellomyces punctatus DAOM BR117]|uniref:Uncharacterized protein n=1 Tax=Spizellomyces punctatus (strain DAOM BR117) TaxID=645134 RepID=A0A0L0HTY5_SPIPD|nr:uncharacterized protein SPPG_08816 [Spizellomyces punctatus DAOM BR117]KND04334.1 hypothetical protein SPPG_08816 [Spizellomyces punctatus DAOM BR117]|eukprot:XP_016612373.1 hypothetical protein SPPG_08816 [Spizellomyces punctatus DAOM BR117]